MREKLLFGIEGLMTKNTFMVSQMYFMEIVHVKLPYEGGKSIVTVISRQDCLLKLSLIYDSDAF